MTLAPFAGVPPHTPPVNYYPPQNEALRQRLNAWLCSTTSFDAIVDAGAVLGDSEQPSRLLAGFDSGDYLHPGDAGNRVLAAVIDLDVLLGLAVVDPVPDFSHKD